MERCIQSAELLSQRGRLTEALWRLNRGLKLIGPSTVLYSQRARLQTNRRHYAAALMDLERAIELSPRDFNLYAQRSDVCSQLNRLDEANRDIKRSIQLSPGNDWLRFAQIRLLLFSNRKMEAARAIGKLIRKGSEGTVLEAIFYRGCLRLKSGFGAAAAKDFYQVVSQSSSEESLSMRARFYGLAAKVRDARFRNEYFNSTLKSKSSKLYLCGLGLFPPYTVTLEVLHAMSLCEVLINNVSGAEVRDFLSMFSDDVRPATYDNKQDEDYWVRYIIKEVLGGRNTAFVTRGHPLVFGGLGPMLVRQCRALGIECEIFGAVSSIDTLLSSMGCVGEGDMRGVQVYESRALRDGGIVNARHPLLVFFYRPLKKKELFEFRRTLLKFYSRGQRAWMFGPKYDVQPVEFQLGDLSSRFSAVHSSLILSIPPGEGAPQR